MARIMGLDYGSKRTGIAVTDPLQIIVSGLDTVETNKLRDFIDAYFLKEEVEQMVIGLPTHKDGNFTSIKPEIDKLVEHLNKKYPLLPIEFEDESYTSTHAKEIILFSGTKKKKRRDKSLVDKISAVLILQRFLKHI
ncbi:MAG: Holliday junction resolvase RuvX [Saprospiraceae bacterium]